MACFLRRAGQPVALILMWSNQQPVKHLLCVASIRTALLLPEACQSMGCMHTSPVTHEYCQPQIGMRSECRNIGVPAASGGSNEQSAQQAAAAMAQMARASGPSLAELLKPEVILPLFQVLIATQ